MATEAVESQRRRRGAGRNLPAAIGVGLLLGALVIGTLFTYRFGFVVLLVLVISGAVWELVRALGRAGAHPPLVPLLAGVLAMDLLAWFRGGGALAVAFLLTALGCVVWRLAEGPTGYLRDVSTAVFVAMYVPVPGRLRGAAGRAGRRRPPGGHLHRDGGVQRRRGVHGRRAASAGTRWRRR